MVRTDDVWTVTAEKFINYDIESCQVINAMEHLNQSEMSFFNCS